MGIKNEALQDTENKYVSPFKNDVEKIFKAWDFEKVIRIVLDDGREITQTTSGFADDDFGTVMLHIVPWRVEADVWLGGLSPSNQEVRESGYYDRAVGRKEYTFCESFNKRGSHRTWGLCGSRPIDSRAELMMRFACLQYLAHFSTVDNKAAECLPQNGYSAHKGAVSFYVCYQGVNLIHFSLGFAGSLDKQDNWNDACEYECTCKVAKNLWSYLKQAVEQHCDLQFPSGLMIAKICTTEGIKKSLEDL